MFHSKRTCLTRVLVTLCLIAGAVTPLSRSRAQAQSKAPEGKSDLDALMARALARRDVTRRVINDYILDEAETFAVIGPGEIPLYRTRRDYLWYVRDGMHVRSPVKVDGVTIGEDQRLAAEKQWVEREARRRSKEAERAKKRMGTEAPDATTPAPDAAPPSDERPSMTLEPRFVSDAYFLDFKFDPGNYYLAGRETLEGRDVLRIEYYPTRMFDADEDARRVEAARRRGDRKHEHQLEAEISRKMNKTAMVTLWVDPAVSQIVRYTFDNVWLDFLPAGWLVKIDDLRASMVMSQPFKDVWLPRTITIHAGVTLATGSYDASLTKEYAGYREAEVKSKIRIGRPGER